MKYVILMLFLETFLILTTQVGGKDFSSEVENAAVIADRHGWQTEVVMDDGSRCDILNDTHAIEVDWANKWAEAPGQAVLYSIFTGKKPKVILLIKNRTAEKVYILRCKLVCEKLNIEMEVVDAI